MMKFNLLPWKNSLYSKQKEKLTWRYYYINFIFLFACLVFSYFLLNKNITQLAIKNNLVFYYQQLLTHYYQFFQKTHERSGSMVTSTFSKKRSDKVISKQQFNLIKKILVYLPDQSELIYFEVEINKLLLSGYFIDINLFYLFLHQIKQLENIEAIKINSIENNLIESWLMSWKYSLTIDFIKK